MSLKLSEASTAVAERGPEAIVSYLTGDNLRQYGIGDKALSRLVSVEYSCDPPVKLHEPKLLIDSSSAKLSRPSLTRLHRERGFPLPGWVISHSHEGKQWFFSSLDNDDIDIVEVGFELVEAGRGAVDTRHDELKRLLTEGAGNEFHFEETHVKALHVALAVADAGGMPVMEFIQPPIFRRDIASFAFGRR